MKSSKEQKKEETLIENKDYPVQKIALKDNKVTEEIVEESVEELNPEDGTRERG